MSWNKLNYFSNISEKGEEITIHYSGGLKGRQMRKKLMKQGWFFDCQCPRCMSGNELGSHMSSLICKLCTHNQRGSGNLKGYNRNYQ